MTRILPTKSRLRVQYEPGRLRLIVRVQRNWFVILFMSAWLGGWAFGELFAIRQLLTRTAPIGANAFLLLWLVGWTVGGAFALYTLAWGLVGREEIAVDGRDLAIRHLVGRLGRTREFDLAQIRNLRVEPSISSVAQRLGTLAYPGMNRGAIAFDYGARTYRMGVSLEGEDVSTVVDAIKERLLRQGSAF